MSRDIFYRRSFHSDRDLHGFPPILESDPSFPPSRKSTSHRRIHANDAGLEAPRNSLDVATAGLLDLRRQAQMEIPMGYELTRSLTSTTGRRNDYDVVGHFKAKPAETGQKPRTSVVARLMGLDPMPPQEDSQVSRHRSSRMLTEDLSISQDGPSIMTKQAHKYVDRSGETLSYGEILGPSIATKQSHKYVDRSRETLGYGETLSYGELPFRKHPQEKQLEEFKKEFHTRQSLQRRNPVSLRAKLAERDRERLGGAALVQDSEEFLDAIDFLQTNREFFARVLNDPTSVFAKHQQQRSDLLATNRDGHMVRQKGGGNLARSFSECRKDFRPSYDSAGTRKHDADGRYDPASSARLSIDQTVPTRIVVLKPNTGKYSSFKKPYDSNGPLSPSSYLDLNTRTTKAKDGKENLKQVSRERMVPMRSSESGSTTTHRSPYGDVRQDAKDIARRIVKHMKEDMNRRLLEDAAQSLESIPRPVKLGNMGRKLLPHRGGLYRDASGISDNEGYFASSGKSSRDNGKLYSSLPSSPSLARSEMDEEQQQFFGSGNRKSMNRAGGSGRISKEISKGDAYAHHYLDSGSILDGNGHHDSIIKEAYHKDDGPKVLPRSLSAPSASIGDSRILEFAEKPGSTAMEPATFSRRSKPSESSLFKGRILSFKDNLLSGKKKNSKKQECRTSLGSPDDAENVDTVSEQGKYSNQSDGKEFCHDATSCRSDATSVSQDDENKEPLITCLADSLSSDASMTPKALVQRSSVAVDLMDNTSEASVDNCEQPSPVSVLDITYREGSPNSDIREMHSKHHDLQMEHLPDHKAYMDTASEGRSISARLCKEEPFAECDSMDSDRQSPSTIWDISCPPERQNELIYIRDILAFAGFTRDGNVSKHPFSMDHGLDPAVFAGLEDAYKKPLRRTVLWGIEESSIDSKARRLLFDVVDEILSVQLRKPTCDPWLTTAKVNALSLHTGKKLLEQIWSRLSYHGIMPCESEETLCDIVAKDLTKENPWVYGQAEIQSAATELERLICGDLIREFVHEYLKR